MELSIIIVNYNVKHFLEQCLLSVQKALVGIAAEVIVVDNNSADGSQQMLREKFGTFVHLIENRDNPGFSKANNQGIRIARGRYVLLLNPDTIVEEMTFSKCLAFMDQHPKGGALGVRMIDGKGHFLPESKRALPTPWVSFYKIFGLAALLPHSKRFGKYHLTYLDPHETHEIEILSGAFMWMRKSALDEIGYLDETFFMYGEDIDLSYRFLLGGYQNYYFADTQIIHYKGESTKKGSLNYVRVFYQAMIIFAEKHFGGSQKRLFITTIRLAVYFRALIAIVNRLVKKLGFPLIEGGLIYGIIFGIKAYWEHYVKYIEGGHYPLQFTFAYMPVYALIFVVFLWIAGAYKKPYRLRPLILAPFWGFLSIATGTYLFSFIENFSRAIVGLSAVFTMVLAISSRGLLNRFQQGSFFFTEIRRRRILLAGDEAGLLRLSKLIRNELDYPAEISGAITLTPQTEPIGDLDTLGFLEQLPEVVQYYRPDEVIFCNQSIATHQIMDLIQRIPAPDLTYKIVPPEADYIVGPQSIHTSRYGRQVQSPLQSPAVRQQKRIFDLVGSLGLLITYPILFWAYKRPAVVPRQLIQVLRGAAHLVGYAAPAHADLPPLKPALLSLQNRVPQPNSLNTDGLNRHYARTYNWELDLEILLKGWRRIGVTAKHM